MAATFLVAIALLGFLQLALFAYARGVAAASAHEAARVAAEVGRSRQEGLVAGISLLRSGLGPWAGRLEVRVEEGGGEVVGEVSGTLPSVVPFVPNYTLQVEARVAKEEW